MKVILAKTAGFCMGVRRAMNAVIEAANRSQRNISTLGPLVHNQQAMEMLKTRKVRAIADPSEMKEGLLFIRAHGVAPAVRRACDLPGVEVCDLTCPHVRRAQELVQLHTHKGFDAVIAGDKNHAEVVGLLGHASGRGHVVSTAGEVAALPPLGRVCLVAQTTQNTQRFEAIAAAVMARFPDAVIHNTICRATEDRQEEVRDLAARVDAMIVVGGRHSANTVRLADIAREGGVPTFHIETADELVPAEIQRFRTVGVTAGASTPHWVFQAAVERLHAIAETRSMLRRCLVFPFKVAVYTYLYLGAGSAAMTYAVVRFLGIEPRASFLLESSLYIMSMHILNRFTDRAAAEINDPLRMGFFRRAERLLVALSVIAAAAALGIAATFGLLPALLMAASLAAGIGYNVPLLPPRIGALLGFCRIKEIPGSKDVGPAAAWATVAVLLPSLAEWSAPLGRVALAFFFVFLFVILRFLLFDLKDLEGDRIVGNETMPLLLGKARIGWLLFAIVAVLGAACLTHALAGPGGLGAWAHPAAVGYAGLIAFLHFKKPVVSNGVRFELAIDAQFIIVGLAALAPP